MTETHTLRVANLVDLAAVDTLLARSYPKLLKRDYAPSVMVTVVPIVARARPELLASGRYFVVEDGAGRVVGAGGYSLARRGPEASGWASIRHVATDPDVTRQGIGRRLMQGIFASAEAEGVVHYDCLSTLTAVAFYTALGFRALGEVEVPMTQAIGFTAVRMQRDM